MLTINFIHIFLAIFEMTIVYYLALSFIGVSKSLIIDIASIVIVSLAVFISKDYLKTAMAYHIIILVVTLAACLWLIGRIPILYSIIGSLLGEMTLVFGFLLLIYPLLIKLGIKITFTEGIGWIYICLTEAIAPLTVLVFLRIKKWSLQSIGLKLR